MSIALKSFIAGALEAVGDKFDEERKTTRESLANRTKNAYNNYLTYQEQAAALKEEIKKRDALAMSYQDDLTEQERIAIGSDSSNVFLSSYEKVLNAGNPNGRSLRDFIQMKKEIPAQNYADWVQASTSKQPDPVAPSLENSNSFFGVRPEIQQRDLGRMAGSVGLSADQLMAYERPADKPMLSPVASLNTEALAMPKSAAETQALLFDKFNKTTEGTPERQAVVEEAKAHADKMAAFDKFTNNTNYQSLFANNRYKAYGIIAEPNKFTPEDQEWAKTFVANDTAREIEAAKLQAVAQQATQLEKEVDFTPFLNSAIKNDLGMIPSRTVGGRTTYIVNGKSIREGTPEADELLKAARINAAKRILSVAGMLNEDGSLKDDKRGKMELTLSTQGINVVTINGKKYLDMPKRPTPEEFDKKWATMESGESLLGPDGKLHTKK